MKRITQLMILILFVVSGKAQSIPDSIVVYGNTYQNNAYYELNNVFVDSEILKNREKITITSKRKISDLLAELKKIDNESQLLVKFDIDTNYIKENPAELIKLYNETDEEKIVWNEKQKELIFEKLSHIDNYKSELRAYLSQGCCYTMHHSYRYEYVIKIFENKKVTNTYTSRKSIWGYHFPYKDQSGNAIYNFEIDRQLHRLFKRKIKATKPITGEDLLQYLVNKIVDKNMRKLYELSAYSYEKEISELSTDFSIISSEEVYGRGRYIGDEPKTIKITLNNEYLLPNVNLQFLATQIGNTLYSRDSIKAEYKKIVERVQSIPFILAYLKKDTSSVLDIYYFNNTGINDFNINKVNTNPKEWEKHDKYIESLKWYETSDVKPGFDIEKSIKTNERNTCGCNYRFKEDFISNAVFFEITSSRNASSICYLLPDNTVLLYHLQSYHWKEATWLDKNLSDYGEQTALPFVCLLFDGNGNLIEKD